MLQPRKPPAWTDVFRNLVDTGNLVDPPRPEKDDDKGEEDEEEEEEEEDRELDEEVDGTAIKPADEARELAELMDRAQQDRLASFGVEVPALCRPVGSAWAPLDPSSASPGIPHERRVLLGFIQRVAKDIKMVEITQQPIISKQLWNVLGLSCGYPQAGC